MKNLILTFAALIITLTSYSQTTFTDTLIYTDGEYSDTIEHDIIGYNSENIYNDTIIAPIADSSNVSIFIKSHNGSYYGLYIYDYSEEDYIVTNGGDSVNIEITYNKLYRVGYEDDNMFFISYYIEFTNPNDTIDDTASINEQTKDVTNTNLYPNPVSSELTVDFETEYRDLPIEIYTSNGKRIYTNNSPRNPQETNTITVDMQQFEKGVYFVKIGSEIRKVVK